jgi:AraC-like DNA-binding protein
MTTPSTSPVWYAFLVPGLRRLWMRSPARALVMARARLERGIYACAKCGGQHRRFMVQVDHKYEIGRPATLDEFARRLFCSESHLQLLCKPCHQAKTLAWLKSRKSTKARRRSTSKRREK